MHLFIIISNCTRCRIVKTDWKPLVWMRMKMLLVKFLWSGYYRWYFHFDYLLILIFLSSYRLMKFLSFFGCWRTWSPIQNISKEAFLNLVYQMIHSSPIVHGLHHNEHLYDQMSGAIAHLPSTDVPFDESKRSSKSWWYDGIFCYL